jgi:NTP pyrophosphatase (non-canonical NTP hydrolase)
VLTLDEYQKSTERTAGHFDSDVEALKCWALGVAGEAGEFANKVKKGVYHQHGLTAGELGEELGDVLWYVARAAASLGLSLSSVAEENIRKLTKRYPDGFSAERSKNREAPEP